MALASTNRGFGRIWILILALSPLAGVAGAMIWVRLTNSLDVHFAVDRREAIAIARRHSASLGTPLEGAIAYAAPLANQKLYVYYRHTDNPTSRRLAESLPEIRLQVVLIDPSDEATLEVDLTASGEVLGYKRKLAQAGARVGVFVISSGETSAKAGGVETAVDPDAAAEMAEAAFLKRAAALDFLEFGEPEVRTDREGGNVTRSFVRKATSPDLPGLEVESRVELTGSVISVDELTARIDPEYSDAHLEKYSTFNLIKVIVLALAGLLAVVYACARYVRKTREQEISHRRNLAVGALVGLSFSIFGVLIAADTLGIALRRAPSEPLYLLAFGGVFVTYCLLGLLFGLFWGASEGEVRELFPGKLTSLDALVLGRITSRNVARATLLGTALGSWMLLLSGLSQWPWVDSPQFGNSLHDFALTMYARFPWLLVLMSPATGTIIAASLGLMLPLAFSFRQVKSPRLRRPLLATLAFLGSSSLALNAGPFPAAMAMTAVAAAVLLGSFYRFDLLTAMVALSFHHFVQMVAQIGVSTEFAGEIVVLAAGIAGAILAAQALFAVWGRECDEAEVQPVYAQNQAQRRAMQAEVSAAREAQLRLAPETIPQLDGVSLAAACEPARVVGGDFYDFFPISQHRLGIFLAEGGGTGLSAALSIAYAKGLLMPLAEHDDPPAKIVSRLREALGPLMKRTVEMGLLYAVADSSRATLSGARAGDYPRLLVCGSDGVVRRPEEGPGPPESGIQEWEVGLRPGDRVVLFTDGVVRTLEAASKSPESWISEFLSLRPGTRLDALQAELMTALKKEVRHAKRRGVEDDLSTVLVKFRHVAALVKEEVA